MLKRVHIKGFRSCRDVEIDDLGALVALVGPNGTGKSNILQAIADTARLASWNDPMPMGWREIILNSTVELNFELESGEYRYCRTQLPDAPYDVLENLSRRDGIDFETILDRQGQVVRASGRDPIPISPAASCLVVTSALLPASDPLVVAIAPARSFLSKIRYYPLDEPVARGDESRMVPRSEYVTWKGKFKSNENAGDSVLMRIIDMFVDDGNAEICEALRQLLGPNGLGLVDIVHFYPFRIPHPPEVNSPTASEENLYYSVSFVPNQGGEAPSGTAVDYDSLSLGTRRVIRILTSMLYDESSVMLLEQPEDGLHEGLTTKVLGLLRTNAPPAQLMFASHSSALLNTLKPEEIRLVSLQNGYTAARKLTPKELRVATNFMNEEGPLSDFLETVQEV